MNETQTTLISMYKDITSILERHGIQYFLYNGTLIGAVRHDGFVPWDDDMDLLVSAADIPKVNEVMVTELDPDKYYYRCSVGDSHPHVVYRGDDFSKGVGERSCLFIDIFQYFPYPSARGRQLLTNWDEFCAEGATYVLDHVRSVWFYRHMQWFLRWMYNSQARHAIGSANLIVMYKPTRRRYVFDRSVVAEAIMHRFEDFEAPIPSGYDTILRAIYGDYMTPPPEGSRKGASGFPCNILKDCIIEGKIKP